jgi:hypothetical protein
MSYQSLFKSTYTEKLKQNLKENGTDTYLASTFSYDKKEVFENTTIHTEYPELLLPDGLGNHDFENAKIIFETYKNMTPVQATDVRIWTYLTHVPYWEYMKARRPVEKQPEDKRIQYILQHWFIETLSPANLMRNDIALLWWASYLTYDPDRENPYELTEELFSMLDYTRHLLPGTQGRNRNFVQALLEFVIENKEVFSTYKEAKVRFLMRKSNYVSGYKNFPALPIGTIKAIFRQYMKEIEKVQNSPEDDLSQEDT